MTNDKICVVCIKPNDIPKPAYIENNLLRLNELVNVDKKGAQMRSSEPFEIVEIKDNINIISSPKAKERSLPLVRKIGQYTKFYGIMYIVKMDDNYNLISLTSKECTDYCVKFLRDEISLSNLGLIADDNDRKGRVTITCDEW